MNFDVVQALKDYHSALEERDFKRLADIFAEDATYGSVGLGVLAGRNAILQSLHGYFSSHPEHRAWDESVVMVSARVARSVWRLEARDPATGEKIARRGVEVVTFDASGRIASIDVTDLP